MKALLRFLALAALLATPLPARAHQDVAVSIEDLARGAGVVVEGRVESAASSWNATHTQIVTAVSVRVSQYVKGSGPETIRMQLLGGTVGEITMAVLGQAEFTPAEDVFLFLSPTWESGQFPVVQGEHGKFSVRIDARSGRKVLSAPAINLFGDEVVRAVRSVSAARPIGR